MRNKNELSTHFATKSNALYVLSRIRIAMQIIVLSFYKRFITQITFWGGDPFVFAYNLYDIYLYYRKKVKRIHTWVTCWNKAMFGLNLMNIFTWIPSTLTLLWDDIHCLLLSSSIRAANAKQTIAEKNKNNFAQKLAKSFKNTYNLFIHSKIVNSRKKFMQLEMQCSIDMSITAKNGYHVIYNTTLMCSNVFYVINFFKTESSLWMNFIFEQVDGLIVSIDIVDGWVSCNSIKCGINRNKTKRYAGYLIVAVSHDLCITSKYRYSRC